MFEHQANSNTYASNKKVISIEYYVDGIQNAHQSMARIQDNYYSSILKYSTQKKRKKKKQDPKWIRAQNIQQTLYKI